MSLSKTLNLLLSACSTKEESNLSLFNRKIVDWDVKDQHNQNSLSKV